MSSRIAFAWIHALSSLISGTRRQVPEQENVSGSLCSWRDFLVSCDLPVFIRAFHTASGAVSGITPPQPANLPALFALFAGVLIMKKTIVLLLPVAKAILRQLHRFLLPLRVSRVLTLMFVSTAGISLTLLTLLVVVSGNIVLIRAGFAPVTLDSVP